ncbi:unnamed protein product [Rhizophagus irregularis]|nr:unnamed protein product [Rhizophagus irregularis]CAB5294674.1 unnamed protein product [Rhizophagus irregularis]
MDIHPIGCSTNVQLNNTIRGGELGSSHIEILRHIGGLFKDRRTRKTPTNNANSSEDEQFFEATGSKVQKTDMVEDFNKLNAVFGDRIKDISGNVESSKGKEGKKIETDSDLLNVNKKRIAQTQGARDDGDSE